MARLVLRANGSPEAAALSVGDEFVGSAFSPTIEVTDIEGGHRVRTLHRAVDGLVEQSFDVPDGIDVTIAIQDVEDGHIATFSGANGTFSFKVPNYVAEESARAVAESGRVAAEGKRAAAEQGRVDAELSRVEAESERMSESARAVSAADAAAANANKVAADVDAARLNGDFDGISPEASTERVEGGARLTVTDRSGTTASDILDAGFGTPTATVDQTIGTPTVEVTSDGPNTAKSFHFAFSGLKGEKGDTGDATVEGSVTSKELANGAVTRAKIADGVFATLTSAQIDAMFDDKEEADG